MNIAVFTIAFTSFILVAIAFARDPLLNYYQRKNKTQPEQQSLRTRRIDTPATNNAPDGKKTGVRPVQIFTRHAVRDARISPEKMRAALKDVVRQADGTRREMSRLPKN